MRRFYLKNYVLLLAMMLVSGLAFAQTGSISGTVLDTKRESLPGVSVTVDGTTTGTATDVNGAFKINNISAGTHTVTAKYIGYTVMSKTVNVTAGQATTVEFLLAAESQSLNEVVVVGYGTQNRKDVTGSIATVSSKDFQKAVVSSPVDLIAGKVAGVSITSNGGQPGAGSQIRIRGGASLSATNNPLIVVDGVPLSDNSISGAPSPLSLINPDDIESFSVLKDASAAAIYGSRASNGVLLITTKKGQSGKPQISLNSQLSASQISKKVDVFSPSEFRDFVNTNGTDAQKALLGSANTDWQDEIYQTAIAHNTNLSVSGAYKSLPYRVSVGYLDQDGVLKTDNLQRTSGAINLSPKLFDNHLKINLNLKGTISKSRFANQGAIGAAVSMDPTQPIYSGNDEFGGYYETKVGNSLQTLAPRNPVGLLELRNDKSDVKRSIGNVQFDYSFHFLPELHANLNLGYDYSQGKGTIFVPDYAAQGYNSGSVGGVTYNGLNNRYQQDQKNRVGEFYLNYVKDLKSIDSRIDAVAGYSYQIFENHVFNFPTRAADNTVLVTPVFPDNLDKNVLISYYGRLNYTFKNKYTLTATVRTDGSSRFSPQNRWATFPSAALSWNMKEESFLADNNVVSNLKLRGGYGITGQQEGIGLYDYRSFYSLSSNTAQYQLGDTYYNMYRPNGFYPNRKWEQTATTNIAADFGFFNERLTGSVEYYYKKTKDLLNEIDQPAGTNFSNRIVANIGSMENHGVELTLNSQIIRKKDVSWNLGVNFTYNTNKITQLTIAPDPNYPGARYGTISGGTGNSVLIHSEGYQRGSFYVYQQVYDAAGKPVEGVFVDRNSDGVINQDDLYRYKNVDPRAFFGLSTSVNYKKWSAGMVLRGSLGNYLYNNVFSSTGTLRNVFNPIGGYLNNASTNVLETNFQGAGDAFYSSDYFVQNASFLRIDNVNIGYDFGKVFNSAASLRLYGNVQNAYVFTKYKGLDPEVNSGIDNNFYPRPRTFVLGLNLDF
ncbi:SusC/RagA family TonB-linked outer membrane protein [Mucilaginibacter sp. JRF]|uniref:SusC/RagA family TonB-linked outer membrane protein n=1 Tax=Mucilaginibacter sp. JRF TaxID=2780088 RepID=UPI0018803577|nr:SusC/RagA family TonB-linked outer membrane protein [Mucilaginibacter sp. JRF]MBE9585553.1 SusC/RagA family TonB-linked outer membrane protein [Mucilaginibacter sp. JRF]